MTERPPQPDLVLAADVELQTLLEVRAALGNDIFEEAFPGEARRLSQLLAARGRRTNVPSGSARPVRARRK